MKTFYRYEMTVYGHYNEFTDLVSSSVSVKCREFIVFKETPMGYWVVPKNYPFKEKKRWIAKKSKWGWACEDKEKALRHYIKRSRTYLSILEDRVRNVNMAIARAETMYEFKDYEK